MAAASASAGTPYVDGIADQNLGQWSGNYLDASNIFSIPFPSFFSAAWVGSPPTHIRYAAFVTAPDPISQGGACEQNLTNWFNYTTRTLHLIPVISLWNVAEGGCVHKAAPVTATYTREITRLVAYLDTLAAGAPFYIEPWNEPNATSVSAAQAAAYWTTANAACASGGCTALAGGFVDNDPDQGSQSFAPGCARGLSYNNHLLPYENSYVKALGGALPAIWGFHPYYAVNCEQPASLTTFENALPNPTSAQVWFTEVGAWECYNGQSPPRGTDRQQSDAAYLVDKLMAAGTTPIPPTHVFYYEMAPVVYTQSCAKYTDSALYEGVTAPGFIYPRPAAATIFGPDSGLGAATNSPTAVSASQATFNGTVTPAGIYEAAAHFQYGTSQFYGSNTPTANEQPGLVSEPVSAVVTGLAPNATYHYRLVVTDTLGTTRYGLDQSLRTPPASPSRPRPQSRRG